MATPSKGYKVLTPAEAQQYFSNQFINYTGQGYSMQGDTQYSPEYLQAIGFSPSTGPWEYDSPQQQVEKYLQPAYASGISIPNGFSDSSYYADQLAGFIKGQQASYGSDPALGGKQLGWQPDGTFLIADNSSPGDFLSKMGMGLAVGLGGPLLGGAISGALGGAGAAGAADAAYSGFGDVFGGLGGSISDSLGGVYGAGAAGAAGGSGMDAIEALIQGTNQGLSGSDLMNYVEGLVPGGTQSGLEFLLNNPSQLFGGVGGSSDPISAIQGLLGGSGGAGALGGGTGSNSILGALLGGLLGSTNGSQQAGETTITQSPWGPQQPYLLSGFGQAQNLLGQQQAAGNPLLDPAMQQMQATIRGDYLNPETNPYLSQTVDSALAKAASGVNSQFGTGDNYGGSAHQEWLGRTLADTALPYYFGNYNTERGRQDTAAGAAPGFTQGYFGAQAAPLQNYMNIVGQGYGTQQTQPYYTNPLLGGLSGALAGSQLGGLFGL